MGWAAAMSKGLSYEDAVRLLGGKNSKIVTALDKITGGILLGAAITAPALLAWIEARAEFAHLCQDLVRAFSEHRSGFSRYDRTQRLQAAHSVLVVAAYFDALAVADLPFPVKDLNLTKAEQVIMANDGSALSASLASVTDGLIQMAQKTLPQPQEPYETLVESLEQRYYRHFSGAIVKFIRGLDVWDRLTETDRDRFGRALEAVPKEARHRYEELFRRLATDFPEVAFWANQRDHQATRAEIRTISTALGDLARLLGEISEGRSPGKWRAALARAYRADLERPILESGEVPEGLRVPLLGHAYLSPRFRVHSLAFGESPSNESWWEQIEVRDDLENFLVGYLTSPQATRTPLLVLGQPGSGKSVLTRVLAARLPAPDFLPVRVVLREVSASADLQEQVEQAIRAATGERLDWPALARSAGDALPVLLLDGFDELLQATGVSQTDYLARVAAFQRREADQGRPAAVIVTSRTSVANRARVPDESVSLRLEPFDPERITVWLEIWNDVNVEQFAARGLLPLTPAAVLAHRDLAEQPLLLLMLALYDADRNALQHLPSDLRQRDLYEQLLRRFVSREIVKLRPGIPDRDLDEAIEEELRRLSVVAFAMFNRGSQWVSEADLDKDFAALFGARQISANDGLRAPLRSAEIVLGQFFFVHRSQARRDEAQLEAYEFLHATFGEFLVARFAEQVLGDIAARDAATKLTLAAVPQDDDLLYTLLSFSALSVLPSTIGFLAELMARLADSDRRARKSLLERLYTATREPRPARHFESYRPRSLSATARHAAYSANLMLLAVCAAGSIRVSELVNNKNDAVNEWHRQALLWRSQLGSEEWISLVETLALERLWDGELRDIRLSVDNGNFRVPVTDLGWTYGVRLSGGNPGSHVFEYTNQSSYSLRRRTYFLCGTNDDLIDHTLGPLLTSMVGSIDPIVADSKDAVYYSPANMLLKVWLLPLQSLSLAERRDIYERYAAMVTGAAPLPRDEETRYWYALLLLDRLITDEKAPARLAADMLDVLTVRQSDQFVCQLANKIAQCGLTFLGRDNDSDVRIAEALADVLVRDLSLIQTVPGLEAWVRLAELGLPFPGLLLFTEPQAINGLLQSVGDRRPDLAERARRVIKTLDEESLL